MTGCFCYCARQKASLWNFGGQKNWAITDSVFGYCMCAIHNQGVCAHLGLKLKTKTPIGRSARPSLSHTVNDGSAQCDPSVDTIPPQLFSVSRLPHFSPVWGKFQIINLWDGVDLQCFPRAGLLLQFLRGTETISLLTGATSPH